MPSRSTKGRKCPISFLESDSYKNHFGGFEPMCSSYSSPILNLSTISLFDFFLLPFVCSFTYFGGLSNAYFCIHFVPIFVSHLVGIFSFSVIFFCS